MSVRGPRSRREAPSKWTPQCVAALLTHFDDDGNARATAALMGADIAEKTGAVFSLDAVRSKARELGLSMARPKPGGAAPMKRGRGAPPWTTAIAVGKPSRKGRTTNNGVLVPPPPTPAETLLGGKPLGPVATKADGVFGDGQEPVGCRFIHGHPVGVGPEHGWRYCQQKRAPGAVYCAAHEALTGGGRTANDAMRGRKKPPEEDGRRFNRFGGRKRSMMIFGTA